MAVMLESFLLFFFFQEISGSYIVVIMILFLLGCPLVVDTNWLADFNMDLFYFKCEFASGFIVWQ